MGSSWGGATEGLTGKRSSWQECEDTEPVLIRGAFERFAWLSMVSERAVALVAASLGASSKSGMAKSRPGRKSSWQKGVEEPVTGGAEERQSGASAAESSKAALGRAATPSSRFGGLHLVVNAEVASGWTAEADKRHCDGRLKERCSRPSRASEKSSH